MRVRAILATGAALGAAVLVGPLATPAGATVVTTVSGTTLTIAMTGDGQVTFDCNGTDVLVNQAVTSPVVACSALTKVTVNGDAGAQRVYGSTLSSPQFTAHPTLTAIMGDGPDVVQDTAQADNIQMGPGDDYAYLYPGGVANVVTDLNTGTDRLIVGGTTANDTISATSGSSNLLVNWSDGTHSATYQATGTDVLEIDAGDGNDTINTSAITASSSVTYVILSGDNGNDTLTAGPVPSAVEGGPGTNTLNGGTASDNIDAWGDGDTVNPGLGHNAITDQYSLHYGNRILNLTGTQDTYVGILNGGDATYRSRPSATPSVAATTTASLRRPGSQSFPVGLNTDEVYFDTNGGGPNARHLADLVLDSGKLPYIVVVGDAQKDDLLDVTEPGTWTMGGTSGTDLSVIPGDGSTTHVNTINITSDHLSVHNAWPDANTSFAHRVIRDLMFRFGTPAQVEAIRAPLANHTKTTLQIVSAMIYSDEYRGLDVDRSFLDFLHRASDPSGRTYWIKSLRNGKSLLQFRAQLFGSNEYFTKAGGTNAAYMEKAYEDVLGRRPDTAGKTYWTNKLNNGANRGAVARQFLSSTEARRNIVKDQFLRFLDRLPTTTESTNWVTDLASANGEQALITSLVTSPAYVNRN